MSSLQGCRTLAPQAEAVRGLLTRAVQTPSSCPTIGNGRLLFRFDSAGGIA